MQKNYVWAQARFPSFLKNRAPRLVEIYPTFLLHFKFLFKTC